MISIMSTQPFAKIKSPSRLQWWEWGDILGIAGVAVLTMLLASGHAPHPAVVAVLLHIAADFTCQSPEMVAKKEERGRHLLLHALAAGGFPLAIAGLTVGNPVAIITWVVIGTASHYVVDWTRKFGLQSVGPGVGLDQASHLAVILGLTLLLQ